MSHYSCPICSGSTTVIETRLSNSRLRRRRRCPHNHRFTTIEVPHEVVKNTVKLIDWLTKQKIVDADLAGYAKDELKAIFAGTPQDLDLDDAPQETSDPSGMDTPICGAEGTDGQHPDALGRAPLPASPTEEGVPPWTGATLLHGRAEASPFEAPGCGETRPQDRPADCQAGGEISHPEGSSRRVAGD